VVVGGTASTDFPVTPGAFQATLQKSTDSSSASRLGETDAYIAKFNPMGELLWCTYLGGAGYDRAYAVEVDKQDRIIVAGRAGPVSPTTPGAFQPNFIDTFGSARAAGTVEYGSRMASWPSSTVPANASGRAMFGMDSCVAMWRWMTTATCICPPAGTATSTRLIRRRRISRDSGNVRPSHWSRAPRATRPSATVAC